MKEDILDIIAEKRSTMSKGHRRVADYVTAHLDGASYMTASALGEAAGVSESTVVRFAASLDVGGYPAFLRRLEEAARHRLTAVQRVKIAETRFGGDIPGAVLSSDMEKIRDTMENLSREGFERAMKACLKRKDLIDRMENDPTPLKDQKLNMQLAPDEEDKLIDSAFKLVQHNMPRYAPVFSGTAGILRILLIVVFVVAAIVFIWKNPFEDKLPLDNIIASGSDTVYASPAARLSGRMLAKGKNGVPARRAGWIKTAAATASMQVCRWSSTSKA